MGGGRGAGTRIEFARATCKVNLADRSAQIVYSMCCRFEIEPVKIRCLIQPQYTDTGPTIPSFNPITPGAWQVSHQSTNF